MLLDHTQQYNATKSKTLYITVGTNEYECNIMRFLFGDDISSLGEAIHLPKLVTMLRHLM